MKTSAGIKLEFAALSLFGVLLLLAMSHALAAQAPASPASGPAFSEKATQLLGLYESLAPGSPLPDDLHAAPTTLDVLPLIAPAARRPEQDPKDLCQVLGPFRLMARPDIHFEILRDAPNKLVLLFENNSWGMVRTIGVDAEHIDFNKVRPMWNGDSIATWEGDTLVIDSVHFTNKTWLNEAGVLNSRKLHLKERLRIAGGGEYLEYKAVAEDPEVLNRPVTYTRYFRRTPREIQEYNCFTHKPPAGSASH